MENKEKEKKSTSERITTPSPHKAYCQDCALEMVTFQWKELKPRKFHPQDDEASDKVAKSSKYHKRVKKERRINSHVFARTIAHLTNVETGIVHLKQATDRLLTIKYRIHPEALPFLFHVDGCAKNLLLYLVFFKVDLFDNSYLWNEQVIDHFKKYTAKHHGKEYKSDTIKQAHEELKKLNITLSISRGRCFLNPILASCNNRDTRRRLANEYSQLLLKKGKAPLEDIYPIYRKTK